MRSQGARLGFSALIGLAFVGDLARDPSETTDLARDEPLRANDLQRSLFAHFKEIGHDLEARSWRRGLNPVYQSQGR